MDGTIIGQGSFIQGATAVNQVIVVPSNLDSLEVWNYTQAGGTAGNGFFFYWQRPNGLIMMGDGTQGIYEASGALSAVSVGQTASGAFVLYDPSLQTVGPATALTALTAANPGVVTTGSTAGLAAGSIVRLTSLNNQSYLNGIDFSVGYGTLTPTTFSVDYLNSTGSVASTSGNWSLQAYNPLFYPRRRTITNISSAAQAVITLSVDHGFTVGQQVRLNLVGGSAVWGAFASLSNYGANSSVPSSVTPNSYTIVAVNTGVGVGNNTITINANTTGFGTFRTIWEAIVPPYTPAEVIPVGEDTATSLSSIAAQTPVVNGVQIYNTNSGILADSTVNTGYLGMILAAGALLPAGSASDVVFWKAYKSTFGGL